MKNLDQIEALKPSLKTLSDSVDNLNRLIQRNLSVGVDVFTHSTRNEKHKLP